MHKILIVVDMQKDFIDGALGTPQAEAIVPKVKEKIKNYMGDKNTIIFTRDTHKSNYLNTQEGINLPVEHCIENTAGWHITDEFNDIINYEQAKIFDKPNFASLDLAYYIKELKDVQKIDIEEIEIVGLCTDICVVSNAMILKAIVPEIKISVDANCCAGVTEESHKAALMTMKMCQVDIINA